MGHALASAAASAPAGLRVEALSHAYGARRVVEAVALELPAGEVHCLVGPSGCGKTTVLRLIAGLEPLQGGRIQLDGGLLADGRVAVPPEARRIGLMFQDYALFPHLRVLDNVAFGLRALDARQRRQRALELLAQVNLSHYPDAWPHMLSGGEQQRVAVARALVMHPSVLLADEPTGDLDERSAEALHELLLDMHRGYGLTSIIATHNPRLAAACDRVFRLEGGQVTQS
jgi:iron(III) transport system ATP-binding protein